MSPSVYIAGPMRGKKYYNFPAFDSAAGLFREIGCVVYNPADLDREHGFDPMQLPDDYNWHLPPQDYGWSLRDCIARDLNAVQECDIIYMLHGFAESVGAMAELHVARWAGKIIIIQGCKDERKVIHAAMCAASRDWGSRQDDNKTFVERWNLPVLRDAEEVVEGQGVGVSRCASCGDEEKGDGAATGGFRLGPEHYSIVNKDVFPEDAEERKKFPMYTGLVCYFPDALAAVARVSFDGNEQHHPGSPLHWDRSKSKDEPDAMMRHAIEGRTDLYKRAQGAWRALAWLQKGIEEARLSGQI